MVTVIEMETTLTVYWCSILLAEMIYLQNYIFAKTVVYDMGFFSCSLVFE